MFLQKITSNNRASLFCHAYQNNYTPRRAKDITRES
jgi:hypothetical protein